MAERISAINSKILIWARETSGTTIQEAKEKFGEDKLAAWENGTEFPTYAELKKIGSYYRKPIAVFFFPEPPSIKDIPASCRTLPVEKNTVFNRDVTKMVDWARTMQINLYELHDQSNPAKISINSINFDLSDLTATARHLRSILSVDLATQKKFASRRDAFEFWRDCFYEIGIYVFKNAFKDTSVSGFCIYDDIFPVICINNSLAYSRQIFTLFHEVYHLIRKTSGVDLLKDVSTNSHLQDDVEYLCNRFAGKFLVPDGDFTRLIAGKEITDKAIQAWSNVYSVSRVVILHRLLEANCISYDFYHQKSEEYFQDYFRNIVLDEHGKKKGGGNYYATQSAYKGKQYLELAFSRYYQNRITLPQLSRYLNMKVHSISELASQKGWGAV